MIGLSFIINRELTEKYNWVDVKEIADEIINEEEFEIYLAQHFNVLISCQRAKYNKKRVN